MCIVQCTKAAYSGSTLIPLLCKHVQTFGRASGLSFQPSWSTIFVSLHHVIGENARYTHTTFFIGYIPAVDGTMCYAKVPKAHCLDLVTLTAFHSTDCWGVIQPFIVDEMEAALREGVDSCSWYQWAICFLGDPSISSQWSLPWPRELGPTSHTPISSLWPTLIITKQKQNSLMFMFSIKKWSVVAERSSALDSSSGVARMWVRIPAWPVAALVSLSKTLNHNCFVLRMGRKAVGPVCCVMHVKEHRTLIVKEKGGLPRCFWIRALSTQQGGYVRVTNLIISCSDFVSRKSYCFCRNYYFFKLLLLFFPSAKTPLPQRGPVLICKYPS